MILSIIVPVYNAEKYLSGCIESIIAQDFADWELILVNDGSTDASGEICNEFADKDARIRVIHSKNGGPSIARNLGLSSAKGDFITFIDADDHIRSTYLSKFSYKLGCDFEIQGLLMNYISFPEKNIALSFAETAIKPIKHVYEEAEHTLLSRGPYCKLFKRDIIEKNKVEFPIGISFGEDAIFVKRYLSYCNGYGRTIAASDYIYNHFPNSGSLTSKRHSGKLIYEAALMDYNLFCVLEQNWGEMNKEVKDSFLYKRALEFYNSICLFFTEPDQTFTTLKLFIHRVKNELYQGIRSVKKLPITYKLIKFMLVFPSIVAVSFIKSLFAINNPKV